MSLRLSWVLSGSLLLCTCGDDKTSSTSKAPTGFEVHPDDLETPRSIHLEPGIFSVATSEDGLLTMVFPTGSVAEPTDLWVARIRDASLPEGVHTAFLLGPSDVQLQKEIRLRFAHLPEEGLRPVRLDTGGESYEVLADWVGVPATSTLVGNTSELGAFAISSSYTGDSTPPVLAQADEALAQRALTSALELYEETAASDPANAQAHFGAAITRLALLPEHTAIDDLLTMCQQPPVDMHTLVLGPSGILAHELDRRQGASTLAVERGADQASLAAIEFFPNTIRADIDEWFDSSVTYRNLDFRARDRRSGANGPEVGFYLWLDLSESAWRDGASVNLADYNDSIWVDLDVDDDWDNTSVPGTYIHAVSGVLNVTAAGSRVGDAVEVELVDAIFHRVNDNGIDPPQITEVFRLSGSLADTINDDFEPPVGVPFDGLQDIYTPPTKSAPVQAIELCGAGFTSAYIKAMLDEINLADLAAVRDHLDAIAQSDSANSFVWRLPIGTVINGAEIPIGIVEVHALRALLYLGDAGNELLQLYNIIDPDLPALNLFSDHHNFYELCSWTCEPSGGCWETCSVEQEFLHDVDLALLHPALEPFFLSPVGGSLMADDVAPVKASLEAAFGAVIDGLLAEPTGEVLFNFRATDESIAAADELIGFAQLLIDSLNGDTPVPTTEEWILHPYRYFSAPFTRESVIAVIDESSLWNYTPRDDANLQNARLEPTGGALREILGTFITFPDYPDASIYCNETRPCPNLAAGGRDYWQCVGWDEEGGVCNSNVDLWCQYDEECPEYYCIRDICEPREPALLDGDIVEAGFRGDPPGFVNGELIMEITEGF